MKKAICCEDCFYKEGNQCRHQREFVEIKNNAPVNKQCPLNWGVKVKKKRRRRKEITYKGGLKLYRAKGRWI